MKTYTGMNANVALALCVGGGFLLAQTTIFVAFRSGLSSIQIVGIVAITFGMALLAMTRSNVEPSPRTYSSEAAASLTGNAQE
jgi:multidrug transporter EmrE-like cation transporter